MDCGGWAPTFGAVVDVCGVCNGGGKNLDCNGKLHIGIFLEFSGTCFGYSVRDPAGDCCRRSEGDCQGYCTPRYVEDGNLFILYIPHFPVPSSVTGLPVCCANMSVALDRQGLQVCCLVFKIGDFLTPISLPIQLMFVEYAVETVSAALFNARMVGFRLAG